MLYLAPLILLNSTMPATNALLRFRLSPPPNAFMSLWYNYLSWLPITRGHSLQLKAALVEGISVMLVLVWSLYHPLALKHTLLTQYERWRSRGLFFYRRPRGKLILRSMEKPTNKFQGEANIKDKLKVRSGSRRVTGSHQPSVKLFHAMLLTGVSDPAKKSRKCPEVLGVLASLSPFFLPSPLTLDPALFCFPYFFGTAIKQELSHFLFPQFAEPWGRIRMRGPDISARRSPCDARFVPSTGMLQTWLQRLSNP